MTDKKFPSDRQDKFMLRFPEGMRDRIRAESEKSGRSMNAEIVARLEQSFAEPDELAAAEDVTQRLEKQLEHLSAELSLMAKANAEASEFIKEMREMDRQKEGRKG